MRRFEIREGERTRKKAIMATLAMDMLKTAQAETIDQVRPEIRAAGKFEGIQEGIKEGMAEILMDLLESRFDRLPSWVPDRVASAESGEMKEWTQAVLTENSVDDVFSSGKRGK